MAGGGDDRGHVCGTCNMCCKLFSLPELSKPAGVWCKHCVPGSANGCKIYDARPAMCQEFRCVWILTPALGPEWRPDAAGFVMRVNGGRMLIDVEPARPDAWRRQPYYNQFKQWSRRGGERTLTVIVQTPRHTYVVFPETDIELGPSGETARIRSGYRMQNGKLMPYAHFAEPAN